MIHRNTPSESLGGLTPSQIFFGRRLRTGLPCHPKLYRRLSDDDFKTALDKRSVMRERRKLYLNNDHRKFRSDFKINDNVFIQSHDTKKWYRCATVIEVLNKGRSYKLKINGSGKIITRNKFFLRHCPDLLFEDLKFNDDDYDTFDNDISIPNDEMNLDKCDLDSCCLPKEDYIDWIQCDHCLMWFHFKCLNLKKNEVNMSEDFICFKCQ